MQPTQMLLTMRVPQKGSWNEQSLSHCRRRYSTRSSVTWRTKLKMGAAHFFSTFPTPPRASRLSLSLHILYIEGATSNSSIFIKIWFGIGSIVSTSHPSVSVDEWVIWIHAYFSGSWQSKVLAIQAKSHVRPCVNDDKETDRQFSNSCKVHRKQIRQKEATPWQYMCPYTHAS